MVTTNIFDYEDSMAITGDAPATADRNAPTNRVTLSMIAEIEQRAYAIIERLRTKVFAPESRKTIDLRFNPTEAAKMVGRTAQHIRLRESEGKLPSPDVDETGRRAGYSLEQINRMREFFGTLPYRADTDEPVILSIQSFKGGVGKSVTSCHLAQDLALKGYRVCVVDCDPQGSTTLLFGLNPDLDLDEYDTIYPYLAGQVSDDASKNFDTLHYAVHKTYWPNISIIPANLYLYNAEYELAAQAREDASHLVRLRQGLDSIKDEYDVIIIDPPPALGMISLSVLQAVNAMIVPVPPSNVDFSSTAHFFTMLKDTLELLEERGMPTNYKFVKVLVSKKDERKASHQEITDMMGLVFGNDMLKAQMKDSAEVDNAAANFMTVLEQRGPQASRDTYKRALAFIQAVGNEVELEIRKTWPSHREALREKGVL